MPSYEITGISPSISQFVRFNPFVPAVAGTIYDLIAEAFELSQGLGSVYRVSNTAKKRRILEAVVRKLEVDSEVLYPEWLSPFDMQVGTPGRS